MITLPGLIDIHVHFRTPGQEEKEDFYTGTKSALAGGFTTVLDMPNNKIPIISKKLLEQKINLAKKNIVCDVGFYFGSLGNNLDQFPQIKSRVFGLKLFLNPTTGNFLIDEKNLTEIYTAWKSHQPILLHCEGQTLPVAIRIIKQTNKKTHICHVSSAMELSQIIQGKQTGLPITCGVTPHHLFLTEEDYKKLGPFGLMKPYLKSQKDQAFLWRNLKFIDVIESDHAPHTKMEKEGNNPPFGVPGLETTLPLLLTAVYAGKLSIDDIIRLCHKNPAKIFNITTDPKTKIEVDTDIQYTINNQLLQTKCSWSPFADRKVTGRVKTVYLHGEKVFDNGQILTKPGSGKIIFPNV